MKAVKIILISLAALIVVLAGAVVIFVKTFDVNRYKPQILAQAKTALGRNIDFDSAKLDISLKRGIYVKVSDLVISDSPLFQKGDFLRVKEIAVSVDVLGYLFQKQIKVPGILIDTPRVTIIRQKDGRINAASFGAAADTQPSNAASSAAAAPQPAIALPAVLVSSFKLENGAVTYIDRSYDPAVSLDVTDISVLVSRISLTDSFPFKIEAAVLAPKKNILVEGALRIDPAKNEVAVSGLTVATELSDIVMAKIPVALPMTKDMTLPESMQGRIDVTLDTITAGPKGVGALKAAVAVSDGGVRLKEIPSPVHDIAADIKLTQSDVAVDKVTFSVGTGSIECSGGVKDFAGVQKYSLAVDIRTMIIQELISQDKTPFRIEGAVSGPVNATGNGFAPEALRSNCSATADILLSKAKIADLNVLRVVLDRISVIPGLSQTIEAGLSPELKAKLTRKDTVFSDIKLPIAVENGRCIIKNAAVSSDEFMFNGTAEAGFDGAYSIEGDFLIKEDLSSAMIAAVSQLQYLLNDEKQIYIPLKVTGTATQVKFIVDVDYIGKKLLESQAKQQVFKALDKALGQTQPSGGAEGGEQGSDTATAVKEAVGSIIGNIFKK